MGRHEDVCTVEVEKPHSRSAGSRARAWRRGICFALIAVLTFGLLTKYEIRVSHKSWYQVSIGISKKSHQPTLRDLYTIFNDTISEDEAREWSAYYAAGPHLAGKNLSQAEFTRDKWSEFGIPSSEIVAYDVYINYPVDHSLSLLKHDPNGARGNDDSIDNWKVKFAANLEEDIIDEDPTTSLPDRIPTFHGYSASGNVTSSYVYVNYGTYQDYADLVAANISLKGNIAIARYGRGFRGLKVKRAQELGMVGVVIYTDPGDDSKYRIENGDKPYPEGPARQPSSVQRGSVQFLSFAPGDPTTIGYPSKPGCPRHETNATIPQIPSLPISYEDALPILTSLNGHGPEAKSLGKWWEKGGLENRGVKYNIGPSPSSLQLNLVNEQEYTITPLWNVIGIINGTKQDEVIIIGNHRDAWIAGGAADPNSGSAALNEVVRAFGVAMKKGWKPSRTIVFASWDGEEYGLIGSTEWVEEFVPWLKDAAVSYLNVDVGAAGTRFTTAAAPLLHRTIIEATKMVLSPNQTVKGQTIYDVWDKHIASMGSGSDFTAFQDFAGIPSLDVGFGPGPNDPVYHYHSNYDSSHWMEKYGDPGFKHHAAIARLIAIMAAGISEKPVIDFRAADYATNLLGNFRKVQERITNETVKGFPTSVGHELEELHKALKHFEAKAEKFDGLAAKLAKAAAHIKAYRWSVFRNHHRLLKKIQHINALYKTLDQQFLYEPGLDGRSWFKHVAFAPGLWTGYSGAVFPGLQEAIDFKDEHAFKRWAGIITKVVERASGHIGSCH